MSKDEHGSFPSDAQLCAKCSTKAVIKMDGCMTCLNCGDSSADDACDALHHTIDVIARVNAENFLRKSVCNFVKR